MEKKNRKKTKAQPEKDSYIQWMLVVVYWAVRGEMRVLMEQGEGGKGAG